jgi:flagellar hook-associated protein 3 FlgL
MRITPSMMSAGTLRDLNANYARLTVSQQQMSTGKRLSKASDDPVVASASMTLRASLGRYDSFDRSTEDASGWLGAADGALTAGLDRLVRAKELTVRAGNSGGLSDPNARAAMASELRAIRSDLISLANTSHNGRAIFAGTSSGDAYSSSGVLLGNSAVVSRDVDPHTVMQVNVDAIAAFGDPNAPAGDLFAVLDRLANAAAAGDVTALATAHADLDAATSRLGSVTVEIGSRGAQLEQIAARNASERERITTLVSSTEDVDLAQVMVQLKSRENAYQAALQVASKVLPPSLVDYLR